MADSGAAKRATHVRLLIVDDDPLLRLLTRERMGAEGFEVFEAESGESGIAAFGEIRPDLMLLDVEMPGMDGFEVCRRIRELPAGRHLPILILTGRDDVESIEEAYHVGATDFVSKPLNWIVLAHRIRYILRASESFLAVSSQQLRLDEVQRYARLGSWEFELGTGEITASSALRALVGHDERLVFPTAAKVLDLVHPEDRDAVERAGLDAVADCNGFSLEHRIVACDGTERIVHSQGQVRLGEMDECLAIEGFTQDITERRRTEEQVRILAFSDSLTGLANRTAFKLHLGNAIQRASRNGRPLAVLYLDLDQFKRVNDTFGHTAGDTLLRHVADELTAAVRDDDLVSRDSEGEKVDSVETGVVISRLGGDEFTMLLEGLVDPADAGRVAQRALDALACPVIVEGHEIRVTASIGIAVSPHDGADIDSLLRNADSAMYHAKESGRANYQYYQAAFNEDALERLELEANLCRAIQDDRLFVHFQPKLDIQSGLVSGCEALVRWSDPSRGFIEPSEFVPLAESSGLISELGEAVLRQACLSARAWQKRGHPNFKLAVNLSPSEIRDARLLDRIDRVLGETDFDPHLIEYEITESALIYSENRVLEVLEELRDRGSSISLDDFGTGFSSLTNLKKFPVQSLKIDQSFVAGIGKCSEDEGITAAILSMARNLGIRVVAEGIETQEQLDFLVARHCDEVQGFLISPPLGFEAFGAFLESRA